MTITGKCVLKGEARERERERERRGTELGLVVPGVDQAGPRGRREGRRRRWTKTGAEENRYLAARRLEHFFHYRDYERDTTPLSLSGHFSLPFFRHFGIWYRFWEDLDMDSTDSDKTSIDVVNE